MRVRFPRLPDHERAYALIERDDGAVYRVYGGPAGPRLPHEIVDFVVERELRVGDGIWGAIAAGLVLDSQQRLRAEMLAGLVECVAGLDHPSDTQILTLAAIKLTDADAVMEPAQIAAAAQALQVEAARWARLRVGEELSYDWPRAARAPAARRARVRKPRIVRSYRKREGRGPA
jgi:hypothetical protein